MRGGRVKARDGADPRFTAIASGIDATSKTSHMFAVPEVEPNAPIYFLQFSAGDGSDSESTSRFCVSALCGK